jgi:uncharacterized protein YpbB
VAEAFLRLGEKEDDGMISDVKLFELLAYFNIKLDSIRRDTFLKELKEEDILVPFRQGYKINPKVIL